MHLHVYISPSKVPIVIETNLAWAYPYWEARKRFNPRIRWELH